MDTDDVMTLDDRLDEIEKEWGDKYVDYESVFHMVFMLVAAMRRANKIINTRTDSVRTLAKLTPLYKGEGDDHWRKIRERDDAELLAILNGEKT